MNNSGGSYGGGSGGGGGGGSGSGSSRTVWAATTSVSSSGKRIHMEMKQLDANPPPLCSAGPISDNIYHWVATLFGPTGTPYEGGIYFLDIIFPHDYPFKPPQVMFKTRVYHCNVDSRGHLNLPLLSHAWSPAFTVSSILLALRSMFSSPDPYNAIVPSIAHLYLADRTKHDQLAAEWTHRFAK